MDYDLSVTTKCISTDMFIKNRNLLHNVRTSEIREICIVYFQHVKIVSTQKRSENYDLS